MKRVATGLVLLALAGCGGGHGGHLGGGGGSKAKACGTLPAADAAAALPAGFPALSGQTLFGPATQGKTEIVQAHLTGSDFVTVRDELVAQLTAAGYTIDGTDQEAVEAEAQFSGPHEGTIKVTSLCEGRLHVRYKFLG